MATNLGGLTSSGGTAQADHWRVTQHSPDDAGVAALTTARVRYEADATQAGAYTGQLEWADNPAMTSPTTRTNATITDGTVVEEVFTGLTPLTRYYWRVRCQDIYGAWSGWSAIRSIWVLPQASNAALAVPINLLPFDQPRESVTVFPVNVGPHWLEEAVWSADMNVGPHWLEETLWFAGMNVGPSGEGYEQAWLAPFDPTDETPVPHIWWLEPQSGREGDGFDFVGYGFGANQALYDGAPLWQWDDDTEVALSVVTWVSYPASADAYTADREIVQEPENIDPPHQKVGVVVPPGAVPPGYKVRMRTDGP